MRAIATPEYDVQTVYQTCTNSISDAGLRNRLNQVSSNVVASAEDYGQKAVTKDLFLIPPDNSDNNVVVVGTVTKKELKDVYSQHMVNRAKPARAIYDDLLSLAPLGRCPFCGLGYASTLDHYLPKTKYPLMAVLPLNLVPSCKDCNTGKSTAFAITKNEQCLHPYFDHQDFITDQWLFAEVEQTTPATLRFYVDAPARWDDIPKERVKAHFKDFKLAARFSIEAGNQLSCLRDTLVSYRALLGIAGIRLHLSIEAQSHFRQHCNSWQTAMFQALAANDWYCDGGFN